MPHTAKLERFLQKAQRLYSLPAVALEVLELTRYPQVDLHALKLCIENDPALTTKVLRVVNSALFGLSCEVSDLNQALALLGIKPLKLLVLGFSLSGAIFAQTTSRAAGHYWRRALTKAVAARELSQHLGRLPGDEPFLAALVGDIGMLVLIQELGEPYARLVEKSRTTDAELTALEIEALGFDHRQLTLRLLEDWRMPESLASLARVAHSPAEIDSLPPAQRAAPRVVYLAGLLAELLVDGRKAVLPEIVRCGWDDHRLSSDRLAALVRDLQAKVDELADVLSLTLPPEVDYRDVLARAHEQLSCVAADVSYDLVAAGPADDSQARNTLELWDEVRGLGAAAARFAGHLNDGADEATCAGNAEALRQGEIRTRAPSSSPFTTEPMLAAPVNRAATMPDFGGNDKLMARLTAAVSDCRHARSPLSLVLVEIDKFHELVWRLGPPVAQRIAMRLGILCRGLDNSRADFLPMPEARFAIILPDCERFQATASGNQLVREAHRLLIPQKTGAGSATVSVGVATVSLPAKNFSPSDLAAAASRCLAAAQLSGGNRFKSIAVY